MKKILALLMMIAVVFSFSACSNTNKGQADGTTKTAETTVGSETSDVDMSAYPANIDEWTIENMMAYFKAAGVCVKDDWTVIQNEDECVPAETGISKVGSYMSDDEAGQQTLMIFWFDPSAKQDSVSKQFDYVQKNKTCNELFDNQPIDHVAGRFAFCYVTVSLDNDFVAAVDATYNNLVTKLNLQPAY